MKTTPLNMLPRTDESKLKRFLSFDALWGRIEDLKVQETIWTLNTGPGRRVLLWCGAVLFAIGMSVWYASSQFRGLQHREAMECAQLARNVARGQGFTTYVIRPLHLSWLKRHEGSDQLRLMDHPDLRTPPLYPLTLATIFLLAPPWVFEFNFQDTIFFPEQWVILPFNYLCLYASILLVFFWARELFGALVAVVTAMVLMSCQTIWAVGVSGLPTALLLLLFVSSVFCLWRADEHSNAITATAASKSRRWLGASAVLFGLCVLTQYNAVFLLPVMLWYAAHVSHKRGAGWGVAFYAVVCGVVIAPWVLRNFVVSGSLLGFAVANFGSEIPASCFSPAPHRIFDPLIVARRFLVQSRQFFLDLPTHVGSPLLLMFCGVGLLYFFQNLLVRRLRRFLWVGMACAAVGQSLGRADVEAADAGLSLSVMTGNLLILFLPLVAIYGVFFFCMLLYRTTFTTRFLRQIVIGLFVAANATPLLYAFVRTETREYPYPPYCAPIVAHVASRFDNNAIGVSDLPWAMAWVGDRRTLWLPSTPSALAEIYRATFLNHELAFLFLTPRLLNQRLQTDWLRGEYAAWRPIIYDTMPDESPFTRIHKLPPRDEHLLCVTPSAHPASRVLPRNRGLAKEEEKNNNW